MKQIYSKSWALFRASWTAYLVFAVLLNLVSEFLPGTSGTTATAVSQIFIAYSLHRHFLFDEPMGWGRTPGPQRPWKTGRFLWTSLLIIGLPLIVSVVLAFNLAPAIAGREKMIGLLLILILPLYLVALSLFGTALPAAVERGPGYGLSRGIRLAPGVALRLVLGPGLFGVTWFGALILLGVLAAQSPWLGQALAGQVAQFTLGALGYLIGLINTTLAVAVLCQAYRRIVPALDGMSFGPWRPFSRTENEAGGSEDTSPPAP